MNHHYSSLFKYVQSYYAHLLDWKVDESICKSSFAVQILSAQYTNKEQEASPSSSSSSTSTDNVDTVFESRQSDWINQIQPKFTDIQHMDEKVAYYNYNWYQLVFTHLVGMMMGALASYIVQARINQTQRIKDK